MKAWKRAMDIAGAAAGLVIFSPILAAAAVAIRVSMGRPIFFRQARAGLRGRPFAIVKFRTMRPEAPGSRGAASDAERLTPLGRFLRATSIDELPTLWNVLRGDMSLVGPRPLLPEYLERYTPEQARRHEVKPGITGLAQVSGRNALSWEEKFQLDVAYVERRSFLLDVKILWLTAIRVLRREGISHPGEATMPEFFGSRREASGDA